MNPLFSKSSLMILESLSFTKTLYAFDFDGTLSKIVSEPSAATISVATNRLLRELSELAPVAVVSGRGLDDLKQRLIFRPPFLIGNHGLEGLGNARDSLRKSQEESNLWKPKLMSCDFGYGIEIEDKTYSLAIHYRRSRNKKDAKEKIMRAIADLKPGPRVIYGKCVVNILPLAAPHKGIAVLELMRKAGMSHVFYIGDDDTDEDVFGLSEERIMTVRVGEKKNSQAKFFINRQSEINQLLKRLIDYKKTKNNAKNGARP